MSKRILYLLLSGLVVLIASLGLLTRTQNAEADFSLPAGATVTKATLSLNVSTFESVTVNIHRITADWTETGVTWLNFGESFDPAVVSSFNLAGPGWYSADVTPLVQAWVGGTSPNYGLLLEQGLTPYSIYTSSDDVDVTKRPKLEICYTVSGGAETCATIQRPGTPPTDVVDTYIWELQSNANFGISDILYTGLVADYQKQSLIQFLFTVEHPAVTIVKYTNGQEANNPNGPDVPQINPGDPVVWTYRVTNTGNVAIPRANVAVTDDQTGVTPTFDVELSGNGDTVFNPAEVWRYRASGVAVNLSSPPAGVITVPNACTLNQTQPARTAYVNQGTVTIPGATATVQSSYCNPPTPAVTIVKYTNGQEANNPNGPDVPQINPGDPVVWTYRVTNTGNVAIPRANVAVTDDQTGVTPTFDVELSGNGDTVFNPAEVWRYRASGVAVNLSSPPAGVITVPNACTLNQTQPARTAYVNQGTVTIPGATATVQSSYCNPPTPAITIVKYTNGHEANDPNGPDVPQIHPGDPVVWTYRVTNTGTLAVPRANVLVTDDQTGVSPTFDGELSGNGDTIFDPAEVWQYRASGVAVNLSSPPAGVITMPNACTLNQTQPARTAYVNQGTVTIPGATATVQSSYCNPLNPGIAIVKYTNGQLANDPNGTDVPQIKPGDPVVWTYQVTNTGQMSFPRVNVIVSDNQPGVTPAFDHEVSGNGDLVLDPTEIWLYKAEGNAVDTTLPPQGVNIVHDACSYNNTMPQSPAYVNTGRVTVPGAAANANSSYCNPEHYPYFGENGYIGIEDWINGDYDYNDFGFYFRIEEAITWACPGGACGPYLTHITVTTTAKIFDSGMRHLIHLHRIFNGGVHYTVSRTIPAYPNELTLFDGTKGKETLAGAYTSSTGDIDVTLYNTAKYQYPQKLINEEVVVDISIDNPLLNPRISGSYVRSYQIGSTTFHDLDPIMSQYDFWEEGTQAKSRWHLKDTYPVDYTLFQWLVPSSRIIPAGTVLPFLLVVPSTNWIPPFESSTMTGPYALFRDFYTTSTPSDWYLPSNVTLNCVMPTGLSFGPYPGSSPCRLIHVPLVKK